MFTKPFKLKSLFFPLVIIVAVLSGGLLSERFITERTARHEQAKVYNILGETRAKLESTIHHAMRQMHSVIAVVSHNHSLTQEEYSHYAKIVLGDDTALRNMAVARDLVVELVHPISGNEQVIGVDYRDLHEQGEAAIKAVESGKTVFIGPVNLVQGGTGFIARMPVYLPSEADPSAMESTQLLSAVIDAKYLYKASGLDGGSQTLELAISKNTSNVSAETVFFGDPAIFTDKLSILLPVGLPNDQWLLAGRPVNGWKKPDVVNVIRAVSLLSAAILGILTFTWVRSLEQRKQAQLQLNENKQELDAIINSLPSMLYLKEAESGKYLRFNKAIDTLLGMNDSNSVGKTVRELFPAELADQCWKTDRALYEGSLTESSRELNIETLQGNRTFISRKVIIPNENNSPKCILGIYNDISDLRRTETELRRIVKRLQQSESNYRHLVDSNPLCIHMLDGEFRVLSMNQAGLKMVGLGTEEEVIGRHYLSFVADVDHTNMQRVLLEAKEGKSCSNVGCYNVVDGVTKHFTTSVVPLYSSKGEVDRIMGITEEITERKLAEEERNRMQRELQQAQKMEALGQLTGGIAHDFNNILGIILGYAGLAREAAERHGDPKSAGYLGHIEQASIRANNLVTQMLAFSRNDPGEDKVFNLGPLINEDVSLLRATLPSSINIDLQFEPDVPGVTMDPVRLNQVLMNLSINARDVMEGSGTLTISLGLVNIHEQECASCHKVVNGEWVALTVADDGGGIDENDLPRIFEPFYSTKEVGKGTGLGLSVVHGILHGYQGHILVKSGADQGTKFTLLIPPAEFPEVTESGIENTSTVVPPGKGRHVLVVDDEPILLKFLGEMLELHNYQVTTCENAVQAMLEFEKAPDTFDLLLTDQTMPGISGLELVDRVREIRPKFPVVVWSGFSVDIEGMASLQPRVGYLQKPVDSDELLNMVSELIGG